MSYIEGNIEVEWKLGGSFTKLIKLTGDTLDVQDLINAIRNAEASEEGIQYGVIAEASGKEDLDTGVQVGLTVNLLGTWQVQFAQGNYIAKIGGGNLVGGPSGDPVAYSAGVQVLLIQSAASTIVTQSTGSGLSAEQAAQLAAIDGKASQLNFTKTNELDVNLKSVLDTTVAGSGTEQDPWGP